MGKLKYNDVKEYIESFGYKLVSNEYKNAKEKLHTICPNGHEYWTSWKNFKSGRRCPECNKLTFEMVKENIEKLGYKVISKEEDWFDNRSKIDSICENGHITSKRYDNYMKGQKCMECDRLSRILSYEDVKSFVESEGYKMLSDVYINNYTKLILECKNGHIYETTYSAFKSGSRCKKCLHDSLRLDYEEVKLEIESRGYELISKEYINNQRKLQLKCSNGHICNVSLANIKSGWSCPNCKPNNASKGEDVIEDFLSENKIEYLKQHKFASCKDKRELPFDFYIPNLNLIIEYDGEQHFKPKEKFGGEDGFINTIIHDAIKNQYCEDNKIKIIRIPYWDFNNIKEILEKHINI